MVTSLGRGRDSRTLLLPFYDPAVHQLPGSDVCVQAAGRLNLVIVTHVFSARSLGSLKGPLIWGGLSYGDAIARVVFLPRPRRRSES